MPVVLPRAALAARADVGAPAGGAHLLDAGSAPHARLSLAQMDQEPVLERALSPVDVPVVVDRRALRVDSLVQRLDHRIAERGDLRAPQRADRPQRVDLRPEERLVGVDVAHAGDPLLVEEERLHRLLAATRLLAE